MSNDDQRSAGKLFVVGTPIGNVADLSQRARDVLGSVDVVAAEDTRRTRGLLSRIGVQTPVLACHEHNERELAPTLLERIAAGENIALVSDAGMPLISDPGWFLVSSALARGIGVVSVPGPCAVSAALSVAGLATDRFAFEGFLPRRAGARRTRLEALAADTRTLVFYEAVHRVAETLPAMAAAFGGQRQAALVRELTKMHEACYRGTLTQLSARLGQDIPLLGEFVVIVAGAEAKTHAEPAEVRRTLDILGRAMSQKDAVRLTSEITGVPRNEVYRLAHPVASESS
jgi:16S rRNA (cytidine1402-2'-O)-methyltransferase